MASTQYLSDPFKQHAAVARCLKSSMYIHELPPITMHLPLFINHLKITLKVLLKQKSHHFIVQSLS